jgi:patatin-like phospholipase/acyl hydrolase
MKRILSIDGGGIRGIVPGQVLVNLEQKIRKQSGNEDARIGEYFDFIAGTSTGGILTCIYLFPDPDNPGKPKFSAQDAVSLYENEGGGIFNLPFSKQIESVWGFVDEKFDVSYLEEQLQKFFGDHWLSELLKPCLITSYDVEERRTRFFTQHDAIKRESHDFKVRDAARATSAAPTYFQPSMVYSRSGVPYPLIDGGVFANDPTLCAYSEIRSSKNCPTAKDMFIVSLGTGSANKKYSYEKMKDYGMASWVQPIIDIMMSGSSETTKYHMRKMFEAAAASSKDDSVKKQYIRIEPDVLRHAKSDMANAAPDNITALHELGQYTADVNEVLLEEIADRLIKNGDDAVEF